MRISELIERLQNYQNAVGDKFVRKYKIDLHEYEICFQLNSNTKKTKNGDPQIMDRKEFNKLNDNIEPKDW